MLKEGENECMELEEVKKKINHLEYEEIKNIKEDISNIKIDLATNNLLTKQSIETTTRLSETMDRVSDTMIKLSSGIEQSNRVSRELSNKVSGLEDRFDTLEEKTKFDILQFLKQNWIVIVSTCGLLIYLYIR